MAVSQGNICMRREAHLGATRAIVFVQNRASCNTYHANALVGKYRHPERDGKRPAVPSVTWFYYKEAPPPVASSRLPSETKGHRAGQLAYYALPFTYRHTTNRSTPVAVSAIVRSLSCANHDCGYSYINLLARTARHLPEHNKNDRGTWLMEAAMTMQRPPRSATLAASDTGLIQASLCQHSSVV